MSELTAYDPDGTCVKCGHGKASVHYCTGPTPSFKCWDSLNRRNGPEHLCRRCNKCSYFWFSELWDGVKIEEVEDGEE